jgi:hypothetical protein
MGLQKWDAPKGMRQSAGSLYDEPAVCTTLTGSLSDARRQSFRRSPAIFPTLAGNLSD